MSKHDTEDKQWLGSVINELNKDADELDESVSDELTNIRLNALRSLEQLEQNKQSSQKNAGSLSWRLPAGITAGIGLFMMLFFINDSAFETPGTSVEVAYYENGSDLDQLLLVEDLSFYSWLDAVDLNEIVIESDG